MVCCHCSVAKSGPTLCNSMDCVSMPGFPVLHYLPEITQVIHWIIESSIESVMPSNHLILCCPLLLLPSVFPSIRVFSNGSVLCSRCPKYWSFSITPSNKYSWLDSFRIGWFDLHAIQRTLKSLLQHHSSKASILWCSAFFTVQLSQLDMTTGETIVFTIQTGPLSAMWCLCFLIHCLGLS